jgi:outer membrane protein OmpA-like peptidoglycan-associated protein/tetratricopeptide (TPR) repeat protein
MKNKIIILVIMMFFSGIADLKANNRKANRYFNMYRYSRAIPLYKKSLSSLDEKTKKEATERLGDCYRLINNAWEAQSWYSRASSYKNVSPVVYYYLGQALQTTEQYEEAKAAYLHYAEVNPSDPKGLIMAGYCDSIKTLLTLPESAELKNVTSLNTEYSEMGMSFYKEGFIFASDRKSGLADEITFEWTNNSYYDLYYAEPKYYKNYWMDLTAPDKLSREFNQSYHDGPVSFTSDFNTAFLTRTQNEKVIKDKDNIRTNRLKIEYANITNPKKFDFKSLPFNNPKYSVAHPSVSKNGNRIIFSSDMPGGLGGNDLYISENQGGKWTQPENLGPLINSFGNEVFPFWANDTLLYFSSDGHLGFGGLDLFESHLVNNTWSKPENMLKPLNSSFDDFSLAYMPDKKSGFFSSDRPGGKGSDDIYAFRNYKRIPPPEKVPEVSKPIVVKPEVRKNTICGYVLDKKSRNPLENATVFLFKTGTGDVLIAKTDPNGFYCFPVDLQTKYIIKAMKTEYFDDCLSYSLEREGSGPSQPVKEPLLLEKYGLNQTFVLSNILYDLAKWNIRKDAEAPLDELVQIMERNPISIELSSHTDSRASDAYNLLLSQRRAESAVNYITGKGISPARITAKGYGESKLVNRCVDGVKCSEKEHQANRRTEFKITSIESPNAGKQSLDLNTFKEGDTFTIERFENGFFSGCSTTPQTASSGNTVTPAGAVKKPNEVPETAQPNVPNNVSTENVQEETYFTVQVAAGRPGGSGSMDFKGENVFSKEIDGFEKYYIGKYQDFRSVSAERTRIAGKFTGAFIVAIKDGNVVPLNELRGILK